MVIPPKDEIAELFRRYAAERSRQLREAIVLKYLQIVPYLARRYAGRGVQLEDLVQVAWLALLSAIDRFDPGKGADFTGFVIPTILGEIKKYFRDKALSVKIPRRIRELNQMIQAAAEGFYRINSRIPSSAELAGWLGVKEADIIEAQGWYNHYIPLSLSDRCPRELAAKGMEWGIPGVSDRRFKRIEDLLTLQKAFTVLSDREKIVLYLRFYEDFSQQETARQLGISQMHVSRLENRSLGKIRQFMGTETREKVYS